MAHTTLDPLPPKSTGLISRISSTIFDIRFLGVLGQIAFIAILVTGVLTIGTNFAQNASKLGEAQFICRDGNFSYRCAYDFMDNGAGFDISDASLPYVNTDSFLVGLLYRRC